MGQFGLMWDLTFSEIQTGLKCELVVPITRQMVQDFARLSGDQNPLHIDEKWAKEMGFRSPIAHGLLTAAFMSQLSGCFLPGKQSQLLSIKMDFVLPVYPEDVLIYRAEVEQIFDPLQVISVKLQVDRQADKAVVARGKYSARCLVPQIALPQDKGTEMKVKD